MLTKLQARYCLLVDENPNANFQSCFRCKPHTAFYVASYARIYLTAFNGLKNVSGKYAAHSNLDNKVQIQCYCDAFGIIPNSFRVALFSAFDEYVKDFDCSIGNDCSRTEDSYHA